MKTTDGWQIFSDPEDPDAQSLLFEYPSNSSKTGYIRPLVKIEIGARSEHWPISEHKIESYVKVALKETIHEPDTVIRVLNAERTFGKKQLFFINTHTCLKIKSFHHASLDIFMIFFD